MSRGIHFFYKATKGDINQAIKDMYRPIALTATRGMKELSGKWKGAARRNVAAAGFSQNWQNAVRVTYFPKLPKSSADAAAFLNHKVTYADVFEKGLTISGKPILWIPLDTTPQKVGVRTVTPGRLFQAIGQTPIPINIPGQPPFLAAVIKAPKRSRAKKVTMAALKRGRAGKGVVKTVRLFVGKKAITEPKKTNLIKIYKSFLRQVPKFYKRNFRNN